MNDLDLIRELLDPTATVDEADRLAQRSEPRPKRFRGFRPAGKPLPPDAGLLSRLRARQDRFPARDE